MNDTNSDAVTIHAGPSHRVSVSADLLTDERLHDAAQSVYDVLQKAGEATLNGGDKRQFHKLIRHCETLTELLLSPDQTQALQSLAEGTALSIEAALALHQIPWELLRINGQFLCERFAIGRIVTGQNSAGAKPSTDSSPGRCEVLIADTWDLVSTNTEKTIVERRLRQLSHNYPGIIHSPEMNQQPLTTDIIHQAIQGSLWLHFAGHASQVNGQRVLCLSDQDGDTPEEAPPGQLSPDDLRELDISPEVVFLNACGAIQHSSTENETQRQSFVSELLRLGTRWLIGPVVPVLDSQTRQFVTEFYDAIVQGCDMGEAVRRARVEARRKLGPYNLLPLSYVLYGNPSASPFPVSTSMSTTSQTIKPSADSISFPCACSQCGKIIETRHGLGDETATTTGDSALCRSCHRSDRPDVARDRRMPTAGSLQPALTGRLPTPVKQEFASAETVLPVLTPAERVVREHLSECLAREVAWIELKTGIEVIGQIVPAAGQSQGDRNLAELDRHQNAAASELQQYLIRNRQGKAIAILTFLLLPESTGSVSTATLAEQLARASKDSRQLDTDLHHYFFVCSHQGFAEDVLDQLQSEPAPEWYTPTGSLYLHDAAARRTHFREADLAAHNLSDLLQRQGTTQQFKQAVEWLRSELPLVTSVSCRNIVEELKLEADAVEAAMRCVAVQENLRLESTAEFGLALSDAGLSDGNQQRIDSRSNWAQCVLKAVLQPFSVFRRFMSWLRA